MMPWAKESTRTHLRAYLRGIVFHIGIGAAFLILILSPWRDVVAPSVHWALALLSGAGALTGLGGLAARIGEPRLRRLSTPDDFFAVALVSAFTAAGAAAGLTPGARPVFYLLAAVTLAYIPFGKIRHCFYYFFARYFFGIAFGRRGVLHWGKTSRARVEQGS
jgi:nitrate reductase gamma subunit